MVYTFDGTKYGFLTVLLFAFHDAGAIVTSGQTQIPLGAATMDVPTDFARAKKAEERLLSFDSDCAFDLDRLLRCGMDDKEQVAFRYFRLLAQEKRPVSKRLANPDVFTAVEYIKKVGHEIHKLHGFIRFMETESGALYAPFSPENDICDLLLPHFRAWLPHFPFFLHDVKRKKAAVYDGKNSFVSPLAQADILLSADENGWQSLWKKYYGAVNIPCRERLKQMRGYMPARYWKFLPEQQETPPDMP
ncbi:MAG: TIGR03915 family putative DNA repair protein [Clostridia bacterium]|nr:TIGR03915 family putative DNA repair protein [Clostridia bacterium]